MLEIVVHFLSEGYHVFDAAGPAALDAFPEIRNGPLEGMNSRIKFDTGAGADMRG